MTDDKPKGVRKQYPCPFCDSNHPSPQSRNFCEKDPEGPARKARWKENLGKAAKRNGNAERIAAYAKTDIGRLRRSITAKKTHEEGKFSDNKGENNGFFGKKHSPESIAKLAAAQLKNWREQTNSNARAIFERAVEREALATPIFDTADSFFRKSIDRNGFSTEESLEDTFFDNDFDPFH